MTTLLQQLQDDQKSLLNGKPVSEACMMAPHLNSSIDRKTRVAKQLAQDLFLGTDDPLLVKNRKRCYVRFTQLIRDLKKQYLLQKQEEEKEKEQHQSAGLFCSARYPLYKKARFYLDTYEKLLPEASQEPVLQPQAMPVEVSTLEQLQDFFTYLQQGKPPCKIHHDKNGEYISFRRGAFYTDGRIDLCKQVVGPQWIEMLMQAIRTNEHVKHFLLGNNVIGPTGGKSIGAFLADADKKCQIETWYLAGNDLDNQAIQPIAKGLTYDTVCKSLWLKRNPLGPEGVRHIAKMLETNETLEVLDLDNVACQDEGLYYLCQALLQNTSLKTLYLDANAITVKGASYLASYFEELTRVKRCGIVNLFLGMNQLRDEGAKILVSALSQYPHLERLVLSSNRIQLTGLRYLLTGLEQHPSLILLDLGLYKATPDMAELPNCFAGGGILMGRFLSKNPTIQMFDVSHSHMLHEDFKAISQVMEHQHSLMYFLAHHKMNNMNIPDLSLIRIRDYCTRNRTANPPKQTARFLRHSPDIRLIDSIYRNKM
jgi:Ran GTPase-activating protein (RanGAP) involved in mRNA processing and transport